MAAGRGRGVRGAGDRGRGPPPIGAVGAAGLWPAIEQAARGHDALIELSRIVRAKDAADRRDQALWRAGEHERALHGYVARGRVGIETTQQRAQDRALEAAQDDRRDGKSTLVVAQTSNEQLDALNARAQALRLQDGHLAGERAVALTGRPYGLYAGDEIVLRAASVHPQLGVVRNGTRGIVLDVADDGQRATLWLSDGREAGWEREQLDAGSARLGYVSHSWLAQGQTVDHCHVIADRLADANGTYVALTRARESTRLYASLERLTETAGESAGEGEGGWEAQLARLAEQLGRSEREVASIAIALAAQRSAQRDPSPAAAATTAEPQLPDASPEPPADQTADATPEPPADQTADATPEPPADQTVNATPEPLADAPAAARAPGQRDRDRARRCLSRPAPSSSTPAQSLTRPAGSSARRPR